MTLINQISLLIPHYQKQRTLPLVLDRLTLQISPKDEIIIIDDHSPDGVPDCDCPRVRVIQPPKKEPHRWRLNTLRNFGLKAAKNDAVLFLDPDCLPDINLVPEARKLFDVGALYGGRIDRQQWDGEIKDDPRANSRRGDVYGGCMLFSKSRTSLIGWFSEEYNGAWGLGETDFAHKCYHSGMVVGYTQKLKTIHLFHFEYREGHERNKQLFSENKRRYMKNLSSATPYAPRVAVSILTLMRPYYLDQCLRSVARTKIPLKIFLVNQGDTSKEQMNIVNQWKDKWSVHYHFNNPPKWPGPARAEIFTMARDMGFEYLITLDDDCYLFPNAIENLVLLADKHPEFHGISGYLISSSKRTSAKKYLLGGPKTFERGKIRLTNFPWSRGIHEADYICNGFRLVRLNPLITPDPEWTMGITDYDWSMQVIAKGLRLATTGDAGAYHKYLVVGDELKIVRNPPIYEREFRRNREEIAKMKARFEMKWKVKL